MQSRTSKTSRLMTKAGPLNQAGMTLIEIMIVIAIIGGLMAVLGNTAMDKFQKSKVENAKIQIREIGNQLESYLLSCNSYPTTEQGLEALMQSPGDDVCSNWGPEPYLKKKPVDPWGKPFFYESDGSTYVLTTFGRDGKEGGTGYEKDLSSEDL